MSTFRRHLVSIVHPRQVGLEDYEVFLIGEFYDGYLRLLYVSKAGFAVVYIYRSFFPMVTGLLDCE